MAILWQALDRDLEDAEEQHGTAVRGHLQLIDSLQDMQYARMKTMQEHFQSNLRVSHLKTRHTLATAAEQARIDVHCVTVKVRCHLAHSAAFHK